MTKKARTEIYKITGRAFDQAVDVLASEAAKLLRAQPSRYSRFVLAVGWGPTLFDADGRVVDDPGTKRAQAFMVLANDFYDKFGADNRQVTANG